MMGAMVPKAIWRQFAIVATLIVVTVAVYAPGLGGGFFFDDYPNIVDNPQVQPRELSTGSLIAAALSSPSSELKRPLASLTFALDYFVNGGLNATSMKATNIALHVINGLLVYLLFSALFRVSRNDTYSEKSATFVAAAAALAWLLLPINLTAVLYVVQRMESLANLFVLIGLLGYVRTRERMQRGEPGLLRVAAWIIVPAALGTTAKETSILLPLYGLCVEVFVFRFQRRHDSPARDRRLIWFYALSLGLPFILGMAWIGPGLLDARTWRTRDFTLETRLLSEARVVVGYIRWILIPTPSDLSFYHDDFAQSTSWLSPPSTLFCIVGLVGIVSALWWIREKAPLICLGGFWFFACQTLTGTVLPLELIYEHRNYFASMGIVLAMAEALRLTSVWLARNGHVGTRAIPIAIGVALTGWTAILSLQTARAWGTPLSLAEELAARGPTSPRAQYELGRAYIIASRYKPDSPYVTKACETLEHAAALPGSSILPEQALVFLYGRMDLPVRQNWWTSMRDKLSRRPVTVQDDSSLLALASCIEDDLCHFDANELNDTFRTALGKPGASARLKAAYGAFAAQILHDDPLALKMAEGAVDSAPNEPAYRIHYTRLLIARGDVDEAKRQLEALDSMNIGGRLDRDISSLRSQLDTKTPAERPTQDD